MSEPTQTHSSEAVVALITVTERTIIFDYVNQYRDTLVPAPGSAKPLPPGIAKKIARGGTLPPGIAKRYLPQNLLVQLPPRPGYQWVVVDNDVVLIVGGHGPHRGYSGRRTVKQIRHREPLATPEKESPRADGLGAGAGHRERD